MKYKETIVSLYENKLCFDLENRPSAYWYNGETTSQITAFGWRWNGKGDVESWVFNQWGEYETGREKHRKLIQSPVLMFEHFSDELRKADLVYGHNIRSHDLPMLQAHLVRHSLPLLSAIPTIDTLRDGPKTKGMSRSLENYAIYYELEGEKLHMPIAKWERANTLPRDGIELARARVESDVLLQEKLYERMQTLKVLGPMRRWG